MPRLRCTERVRKMIKSIVFNMFRSGRALMIGCWVIEQLHLFVCLRRAWKWFFWHTAVVLSTPVGNKGQTGCKWAGNRKSNNKRGINSFRTAAFEAPSATWFMSEARPSCCSTAPSQNAHYTTQTGPQTGSKAQRRPCPLQGWMSLSTKTSRMWLCLEAYVGHGRSGAAVLSL